MPRSVEHRWKNRRSYIDETAPPTTGNFHRQYIRLCGLKLLNNLTSEIAQPMNRLEDAYTRGSNDVNGDGRVTRLRIFTPLAKRLLQSVANGRAHPKVYWLALGLLGLLPWTNLTRLSTLVVNCHNNHRLDLIIVTLVVDSLDTDLQLQHKIIVRNVCEPY